MARKAEKKMNFDFLFMLKALYEALGAVPFSLAIAFGAVIIGVITGFPIALVRFYKVPVAGPVFSIVVTVAKGLPGILVYFMLFVIFSASGNMSPAVVTLLGISMGSAIESSEAFRGALESIDKSQFDAAHSIGHTEPDIFLRVLIPQFIPVCLPVMSGVVIHAIKALPVAVMIGLNDILNTALSAAVINYRYLEAYIAAAIIFWGIFIVVEKTFLVLEKKFRTVKA